MEEHLESSVVDPSEIYLHKKQQHQIESLEVSPNKYSESMKSEQSVTDLFNAFVDKPASAEKTDWKSNTIIEPIKEIESKYE